MTATSVMSEPLSQEFGELFREHHGLVYRTAYGVTGSIEDAEDIAQTIFLQLLRREFSSSFMKNPRGYLYRAAVNLSLTLVRLRARRMATTDIEDVADSMAAQASSQTEEYHRKLYEEIAKLPNRAAEMLILRYQHGYSGAEIAKMLGTSRSVVEVTLFRARARLKKILTAAPGAEL